MVSNQSKLRCSIPLLLALVVLISCLPVIPAAASSNGNRFWGAFDFSDGFSYSGDFSLSCSGFIFVDGDKIEFDYLSCWLDGMPTLFIGQNEDFYVDYEGDGSFDGIIYLDLTPALSGNALTFFEKAKTISYTLTFDLAGGSWSDGSSSASDTGTYLDELGPISSPVKSGYTFSGWSLSGSGTFDGDDNTFTFGTGNATLTANWTKADNPSDYYTYINIDGKSYRFAGSTSSSPDVTVSLSDSSISFDWSRGENSIPAPSDFLGLSESSGGEVLYSVGDTFTLDGKIGYDSYYTFFTSVFFTTTITIDGQKFIFTSTTEQPAVLLQVTSSGAILSYGDQTLTFIYEGDGNFLGLGLSPFMDPSYLPGESYLLAAGSHSYKSVNDGTGTGSGAFETTIVIDGSVFQFFSDTEYPLVTCYLSSNGVRLVCGDDVRMWRPKYNEEFLGLALSPNSSEPSYKLSDEWFMVRGSSTKYAFEYYSYCVEFEENELSRIFKATATMILVPVSVFFTTEFIPGLPIGSVMLISFVVGLLFFFLKSSK